MQTLTFTIQSKDHERFVIVLIKPEAAADAGQVDALRQGLPKLFPAICWGLLVFAWQDEYERLFFDGGARKDLQDYAVLHPPKLEDFQTAEAPRSPTDQK
jgi:hypothetical protein